LEEIAGMSLGVQLGIPGDKIIGTAEQILTGSLAVPRFLEAPMSLQGYPRDYYLGPPTLQLIMASLGVESVLLSAFERSRDQRFLNLATQRILDFAAYEAGQRQGDGFLWNDHAVSGRISVLARLWRHVREIPDFPAASSRAILSLVERSGRLLAKPSHFTVRTNHGVAQNLALLQVSAAFPAFHESGAWRTLAIERLNTQLPFYVSTEGVVLEHSAGYQVFGAELLAIAIRLSVLNGLVPEPALADAARNSSWVLGLLIRPNGTLPLFGNTSAGTSNAIPVSESGGTVPIRYLLPPLPNPVNRSSLFPLAGYAIWWQADDSNKFAQTVIAWAKHDGHGHKHADEGSVLFWADGVDWVTNTGYWPYGMRNEEAAYSWTGSNAPHQPGEDFVVPRSVQLLKTGESSGARFIEIERRNLDGALFRRQVLQIDARTLLVLDFARGLSKGIESIWTVDPSLRLSPGATDDSFISTAAFDGRRLAISYATPSAAKLQIRRGSESPFAGWVVVNGKPTPADALQFVDLSSSSASAVLFRVASDVTETTPRIHIEPGATAEKWEVSLAGIGERRRISRNDSTITLGNLAGPQSPARSVLMHLLAAPDATTGRAALQTAYRRAVDLYPPWRDLAFYRRRLSYALGVLALFVEVGWFAISRWANVTGKRQFLFAHLGINSFWLAISAWVFLIYMR
jgi:hypothetical protein